VPMKAETSLIGLMSSREFAAEVLPLKAHYPEISIHRIDLSAHFSFPGARDLVYVAVASAVVLNDRVYDMIDERISAYRFNDRPKIIEFTRIDHEVKELLRGLTPFVLLERAEVARFVARNQSLRSFLRSLFASSFPLRILNPYIFRGPVTGRQFFGREDEIAKLRSQTQRSFVISGARRSGKTSLLVETKRRLDAAPQGEEIVVYLTFENCTTLADLPRAVLKALPGATDDYTRLANSERWEHPQNLARLVNPLSAYLEACRRSARVVRFFFDEYDRAITLERKHGKYGLTGVLREVLVRQAVPEGRRSEPPCKVQFAFAGSPLLYGELLSEQSPIYNFAAKLALHNFDIKTLTTLLTVPLRDLGVRVENSSLVAQKMLELTGGHPSTSQNLCAVLLERLSPDGRPVVGVEEVKSAGRDPEFLGEFEDSIDRNISALGRFILYLIAKSPRALFDADYFRRSAIAYDIRFKQSNITLELAGLAHSGYLKTIESNHRKEYRLAIDTVKQVCAKLSVEPLIDEMLAANECTRSK
jgi:hypothetical protein